MAAAARAALSVRRITTRVAGGLVRLVGLPDGERGGSGLRALLWLLPRNWPLPTTLLALLVVLEVALSTSYLLAVGSLLAASVALPGDGFDGPRGHAALVAFAALSAVLVAQRLAAPITVLATSALTRRVSRFTADVVMNAALRPVGVAHVENPAFTDRVGLAQGAGGGTFPPAMAVSAVVQIAAARLGGLAAAVLLARTLWWAPLPLLLAWRIVGGMSPTRSTTRTSLVTGRSSAA